jgi:pimeloyl-ACP methyl ester carboxylesterase/ketosteroid isomerase-like protein
VIRAEYVDIDGSTAFVEIAGEGEPLLCIHTAGQSGLQWRQLLQELPAQGYQVIVPDLPGHGRSDHAIDGPVTDLSVYSAWLATLLTALEVDRPWVIGCSIGGKIALELATDPSVAPRGAIVMAADACNDPSAASGYLRALEDASSPSRADRTYYGTLASVGGSMPPEKAAVIAAMHRREDPLVSTSDLIGWSTHDLRPKLPSIACPVRLVIGEDDFWINTADLAPAAAAIPNCTYERLPGVGHYPMDEIEGFPSVLVGWLAAFGAEPEAPHDVVAGVDAHDPEKGGVMDDIEAIKQLVNRYNLAFDYGDVEAYLATWKDDGLFNRSTARRSYRGHDELRELITTYPVNGRHVSSNFIVDVQGDTATASSYLLYLNAEASYQAVMFGVYADELVRTDDGWKFQTRRLQVDAGIPMDDPADPGTSS